MTSVGRFYLYSNLHIGLCALYFCMEYARLAGGQIDYSYFLFVGTSTVTLYLIHRYIGLAKVTAAKSIDSRYESISKVVPYYPFLGLLFGGLTIYFLLRVGLGIIPALLIPMVISVLYVIPFMRGGRRLRDISYLKIFLIALTWTWFSMWYLVGKLDASLLSLITLEHFIFMLGITLPFDIRDIAIDSKDGVSTIATHLGKPKTIKLARLLLAISYGLTLVILYLIGSGTAAYIGYSTLILGLLLMVNINYSYRRDVYLTGLLDGAILVKGLIGWLFIIY